MGFEHAHPGYEDNTLASGLELDLKSHVFWEPD